MAAHTAAAFIHVGASAAQMVEPSFIIWSDDFAVGHKHLDGEHYRLTQSINEIYVAQCAWRPLFKLKQLLQSLERLAEEHSRSENKALNRISRGQIPFDVNRLAFLRAMVDAVIEEHLISNVQSLSRLDQIIHDWESDANSIDLNLSTSLKAWFIEHATNYDAHLKPVFQELNS